MLAFTDAQIKEATGQILAAPDKITAINASQAKLAEAKQGYKDLDDASNVYTTSYLSILSAYNTEYKYISGILKSEVTPTMIDDGGKLAAGNLFFPDTAPIWQLFQPRLIDAVLGNPTSAFAGTEQSTWVPINFWIGLMKTGFTGTGASQTVTSTTSNSIDIATQPSPVFTAGDTFVAYGNSGWAYGTIDTITGTGPFTLNCTVLYGNLATIGSSATVKNSDAGFSLSERETGGALTGGRLQYLNGIKSSLDAAIPAWLTVLNAELTALNGNDAPSPYAASILTAKTNVNAAILAITTWQALPASGVGTSRYGNNVDTYIVNNMSTRTGQIAARITDINTAYGTAAQAGDGAFTGTDYYFKLIDNINLRLNKTSGSLRQYYQQNLVGTAYAQQISVIQSTLQRDSQTFLVRIFTADADGTNIVHLNDVGSLTVSQSVKIMTNTAQVITTTIIAITDLKVQLAASIPEAYTIDDKARLVVQLA